MPFIKFDDVVTYEHLKECYFHCRKGKKFRTSTINYHLKYQDNLLKLLNRLKEGKYKIRKLYKFTIYEPKKRDITANQFEDKIVQRLICKYVLEPLISPKLIFDNYASQPGKGTLLALRRLQKFMIKYAKDVDWDNRGWVMVADIRKFFYTIDRTVCQKQLDELPMDQRLKDIIIKQIYAYESEYNEYTDDPNKGICIGFQTSQWLAVYYLNKLDHFIKEELHIKYYGRYMDDMYLIHEDREYLEECYKRVKHFVETELNLEFNSKSHIHPFSQGICFLGYHCTYNPQTHKVDTMIRSKSVRNALKRAKKHVDLISIEKIKREDADTSLNSWYAYAQYGLTNKAKNTYQTIKNRVHPFEYEWELHNKMLENPDKVDKDGFPILKHKNIYSIDHWGFKHLVPVVETKRQYDWRVATEIVINDVETFQKSNLETLLQLGHLSTGKKSKKKGGGKKKEKKQIHIQSEEMLIQSAIALFADEGKKKKGRKESEFFADLSPNERNVKAWEAMDKHRDSEGFIKLKRRNPLDLYGPDND